ncbi:hypothetical protein AB0M48_32965 [Lentzea sp. NPDC051208]|uniref:hypothetical protein n=1 Tax=Lentzea sp. NPDC051208 TaxID=3154642 RepID=UPI0034307A22
MLPDSKLEIVECGELVQDGDDVAQEEAERRWNRYVELADGVTGGEGIAGVAALVASLTAEEDYGAHQAVYGALARFPQADFGAGVAAAAKDLVALPRDNSGNVLLILVRSGSVAVRAFDTAVQAADPKARNSVRALIELHESEEWLSAEGDRGVLLQPRDCSGAGSRRDPR